MHDIIYMVIYLMEITKDYLENNLDFFKNTFKNQEVNIYFLSKSEADTKYLSYEISKTLKKEDVIVLNGELGSGKTAFMYGVTKYFNIENEISSPTFTIVNEYNSKCSGKYTNSINIYHFDVYRLEDETEFLDQIGTEYFENGISFIEWGNIIANILPKKAIFIDITKDDKDYDMRHIHIWRK